MSLPLIYIFHPYIRYIYNYYIVHISACSISIASAPRTSPTMMRFGLIRSAVRINSRIVISPVPSRLAHLASRVTRFGISRIRSSALSSIGITHRKTYTCYNRFKNGVFTRNTGILSIKKAPYFSKVLFVFMFILCFISFSYISNFVFLILCCIR